MTAALPERLRRLAADIEAGNVSGRALGRLETALEAAGACWARDVSIRRLRELLDPENRLSDWAAATRIADGITRFENSVGYQRITNGYREPKHEGERILLDLLACPIPARSARAIWSILRLNGAVQTSSDLLVAGTPEDDPDD